MFAQDVQNYFFKILFTDQAGPRYKKNSHLQSLWVLGMLLECRLCQSVCVLSPAKLCQVVYFMHI